MTIGNFWESRGVQCSGMLGGTTSDLLPGFAGLEGQSCWGPAVVKAIRMVLVVLLVGSGMEACGIRDRIQGLPYTSQSSIPLSNLPGR